MSDEEWNNNFSVNAMIGKFISASIGCALGQIIRRWLIEWEIVSP